MTDVFRKIAYENNKKWLNWEGKILIDDAGKDNSWIGRNDFYKPVIVKGNFRLGDDIKVKKNDFTTFDLRGKVEQFS